MKLTSIIAILTSYVLVAPGCNREPASDQKTDEPETRVVEVVTPTSWALVDELGRTDNPEDLCPTRKGKYVALFYWSWHQDGVGGSQCWGDMNVNVSDIERNHPEALLQETFLNDDPIWGKPGQAIFWGKPLYGYYRTTDKWVLRKHAELLGAAGVDVIFFDCSNGDFTWDNSVNAIMEAWSEAMTDGVKTPKIGFLMQFVPSEDSLKEIRHVYEWIYKPMVHPELWFKLDGKPVILAYPDNLTDSYDDQKILGTFNFKPAQPDYVNGPIRDSQWGWLEVYPQHVFGKDKDTEMSVSTAQNAAKSSGGHCSAFNDPLSFGRSYTNKDGHSKVTEDSYLLGLNFQEQWDRALSVDPRVIFVSGWNEWVAGRQSAWPPSNPYKPYSFPDEFDSEKSRDIEPTAEWGDYGDVYYCQMIRNIRKFKGVDPTPRATVKKTFYIGNFNGWKFVGPDFRHYPGNTFDRNHIDHTRLGTVLTDNSGRNDFVDARVARDDENVYFYIETKDNITEPGNAWMRLLINIDRDYTTGWKGYDFCLNYKTPTDAKTAILSKCKGTEWEWEDAGTVEYAVKKNMMEVKIPRSLLGVPGALDFEFKWSDNMQKEGEILDFYVSGDCAPNGRFNFVYTAK